MRSGKRGASGMRRDLRDAASTRPDWKAPREQIRGWKRIEMRTTSKGPGAPYETGLERRDMSTEAKI